MTTTFVEVLRAHDNALLAGRFCWPVAIAGYRWRHHPPDPRFGEIDSELVTISPQGGYRLSYPLESSTALFADLALLRGPARPGTAVDPDRAADPDTVVAFANRWGLLFEPSQHVEPESGEAYGDWTEHVDVLAYAVDIADALSDENVDTLREWLTGAYWFEHEVPWKMKADRWPGEDALPPEDLAPEDTIRWLSVEAGFKRGMQRMAAKQAELAGWSDQEIVRAARHRLLHDEAEGWLNQYSQVVIIDATDSGIGRIDLVPSCLYGAAWRQLAGVLLEERQYVQCVQCPRRFALAPDVARSDKSYCSDACRAAAYRARRRGR